jgi:hypothetical protein
MFTIYYFNTHVRSQMHPFVPILELPLEQIENRLELGRQPGRHRPVVLPLHPNRVHEPVEVVGINLKLFHKYIWNNY